MAVVKTKLLFFCFFSKPDLILFSLTRLNLVHYESQFDKSEEPKVGGICHDLAGQ